MIESSWFEEWSKVININIEKLREFDKQTRADERRNMLNIIDGMETFKPYINSREEQIVNWTLEEIKRRFNKVSEDEKNANK